MSLTYLTYIHSQIGTLTAGLAWRMSKAFTFQNVGWHHTRGNPGTRSFRRASRKCSPSQKCSPSKKCAPFGWECSPTTLVALTTSYFSSRNFRQSLVLNYCRNRWASRWSMVAFIQGTWLYPSGIQADEAQLAIFDSLPTCLLFIKVLPLLIGTYLPASYLFTIKVLPLLVIQVELCRVYPGYAQSHESVPMTVRCREYQSCHVCFSTLSIVSDRIQRVCSISSRSMFWAWKRLIHH